jgi:hypothetical protein
MAGHPHSLLTNSYSVIPKKRLGTEWLILDVPTQRSYYRRLSHPLTLVRAAIDPTTFAIFTG